MQKKSYRNRFIEYILVALGKKGIPSAWHCKMKKSHYIWQQNVNHRFNIKHIGIQQTISTDDAYQKTLKHQKKSFTENWLCSIVQHQDVTSFRQLETKVVIATTACSSASSWLDPVDCRCFFPILKEWSPPSMTCSALMDFIFFLTASSFSSGQSPSLLPFKRN